MKDGNQDLFEIKAPSHDFPEIGERWKDFVHTPETTGSIQDVEFVYKIRVTNLTDKHSDKDTLGAFLEDSTTVSYSEQVVEGKDEMDNALVQCWRQKSKSSKVVLWLLGRNDCFMHPHVASALFLEKGYDLFVLNYSMNGMCRKRGWVVRQFTSTLMIEEYITFLNYFVYIMCYEPTEKCPLYLS